MERWQAKLEGLKKEQKVAYHEVKECWWAVKNIDRFSQGTSPREAKYARLSQTAVCRKLEEKVRKLEAEAEDARANLAAIETEIAAKCSNN